jgi:hypothetical protein
VGQGNRDGERLTGGVHGVPSVRKWLWISYPLLDDLALKNPKAANADPKDFVDLSFIKELDSSGFIKQLYKQ